MYLIRHHLVDDDHRHCHYPHLALSLLHFLFLRQTYRVRIVAKLMQHFYKNTLNPSHTHLYTFDTAMLVVCRFILIQMECAMHSSFLLYIFFFRSLLFLVFI